MDEFFDEYRLFMEKDVSEQDIKDLKNFIRDNLHKNVFVKNATVGDLEGDRQWLPV